MLTLQRKLSLRIRIIQESFFAGRDEQATSLASAQGFTLLVVAHNVVAQQQPLVALCPLVCACPLYVIKVDCISNLNFSFWIQILFEFI